MTSTTSLSIPGNQTFSLSNAFVLFTPWWPSCASCMVFSWRSAGMTILFPRSTRPSWVTLSSRQTLLNYRRSSTLTSLSKLSGFLIRYHLFEKCSFFTASRVESSSVISTTVIFAQSGRQSMGRDKVDIFLCDVLMHSPTCQTERMPGQVVCWVCGTLLELDHWVIGLQSQHPSLQASGSFALGFPSNVTSGLWSMCTTCVWAS